MVTYWRGRYLGGTEESTHLVKGLDYALLRKVKSQMNEQEDPAVGEFVKHLRTVGCTDT